MADTKRTVQTQEQKVDQYAEKPRPSLYNVIMRFRESAVSKFRIDN